VDPLKQVELQIFGARYAQMLAEDRNPWEAMCAAVVAVSHLRSIVQRVMTQPLRPDEIKYVEGEERPITYMTQDIVPLLLELMGKVQPAITYPQEGFVPPFV
jgi:hypothetical protein